MSKKNLACLAAAGATLAFGAGIAQAAPEAARLVPPPIVMPAHTGFMKLLQLLTFFMHLVAVNILLGSMLLAVTDRRVSAPDWQGEAAFMPKVLALAVNFAIAPFLFLQVLYGNFLYSGTLLMAVWWLSIFLLVMFAYYGLYVSAAASTPLSHSLPLAVAALLILFTAFILTNASTLMARPDLWFAWFSRPNGMILNFGDPTLFPRYLHMVIASLAVGGLTMAWRAHRSKRSRTTDTAEADARITRGFDWFFFSSLAQAPVGLLFFFTLPADIRSLFLGGSVLYTLSLPLALAGFVVALFLARQRRLKYTTVATLCVIFLMVCIRALVREASLYPYIEAVAPRAVDISMPHGQDAALALFLFCALAGAAAVFWMIRVLAKASSRAGGTLVNAPGRDSGATAREG